MAGDKASNPPSPSNHEYGLYKGKVFRTGNEGVKLEVSQVSIKSRFPDFLIIVDIWWTTEQAMVLQIKLVNHHVMLLV